MTKERFEELRKIADQPAYELHRKLELIECLDEIERLEKYRDGVVGLVNQVEVLQEKEEQLRGVVQKCGERFRGLEKVANRDGYCRDRELAELCEGALK